MATIYPSVTELVKQAGENFRKEFNADPTHVVCSPGRVNLIGEHVDYCDGFVLPMALPLVTVMVGRPIDGSQATVLTLNLTEDHPHKGTICIPEKSVKREYKVGIPKWLNYVKGVVAKYKGSPPAFQALIVSSVPVGSGLSSSAALELAVYTFLDALAGPNDLSPVEKALACQSAEHEYGGVKCGVMDQFIGIMGQEDHALLIDCRNNTSKNIPFKENDIVVLITNSNVKHKLDESEYPTRRKQCEDALKFINKTSLRDATLEDVAKLESSGADRDIIKRARHVVTEIKRTQDAAEALERRDFEKVGELMKASHVSLRDDFEVSCPELDSLVDLASQVEGVLGSRMTGGGFGGCTVTLVYSMAVDKLMEHLGNNYKGKATFYVCKPSQGARQLCNQLLK